MKPWEQYQSAEPAGPWKDFQDSTTDTTAPVSKHAAERPQSERDNLSLKGAALNVRDVALGGAQGLSDIINTGAQVFEGGARLVDNSLESLGINPKTRLDQWLAKTSLSPSAAEATRNQHVGLETTTDGSLGGKIGRVGGQLIGTLPATEIKAAELLAGLSPTLARLLRPPVGAFVNSAIQGGAAAGAVSSANPDESVPGQVGVGAAIGGGLGLVLPPVLRGASALLASRAAPEAEAAITPQLMSAAQDAAERAGIPWGILRDEVRTGIAQNIQRAAAANADLAPEALARMAVYEGQGLTPTRAMATRNWNDALTEQNLLTEPEGDVLRQIYQQNNAVFRDSITPQALAGREALDPATFGEQFRGPLVRGERKAQDVANRAYRAADAAEGDNILSARPLIGYLKDNALTLDSSEAGKQVVAELRKMGIMRKDGLDLVTRQAAPENAPFAGLGLPARAAQVIPEEMSLRQLSALRTVVNDAWSSSTGPARAQLSKMRGILNDMEQVAGGDLYKRYRELRTEKGRRFEDNPGIDRLISDKPGYYGTDRIEDSQIFDKAVIGETPEQFKKIWARLPLPTREKTAAQVAQFIEGATFSNQARNEAGDVVASAAKLSSALDKVGDAKLRLVFGEKKAGELRLIAKSLSEVSNPPRGTVPQGSAPKLAFLSRALIKTLTAGGKLPSVLGDAAAGAANMVKGGGASRANEKAVRGAVDIIGPYRDQAARQAADSAIAPVILPTGNALSALINQRPSK